MKHPQNEVLQDYFEGLVSGEIERRLANHLEVCDRCSNILAEMAMVDQEIKKQQAPSLPAGLEKEIAFLASPFLQKRRERATLQKEREEKVSALIESVKGLGGFLVHEAKLPAIQVATLSLLVAILTQAQRYEEETIHYQLIENDVSSFERAD